jgi:hypothetical protein
MNSSVTKLPVVRPRAGGRQHLPKGATKELLLNELIVALASRTSSFHLQLESENLSPEVGL